MRGSRFFFILLFAGTISATATYVFLSTDVANQSEVPRENTCGPVSLWHAFQSLGVPISKGKFDSYFGNGSVNGTSLSELADFAVRNGVSATIEKLDWGQLMSHNGAAILFVGNDHFVATKPCEGDNWGKTRVRVHDSNRVAAVWFSRSELEDMWEGEALLLSIPPMPPGAVAVDSFVRDAGLLRDKLSTEFVFEITNYSDVPLTLKVVGTSCKCSEAKIEKNLIEPNESTRLRVDYKLDAVEGRFNGKVMVQTDAPKQKLLLFYLRGAVIRSELISTQLALLGKVPPGRELGYQVVVRDPGDGRLKISNVTSELRKSIEQSPTQPSCSVSQRAFDETTDQEKSKYKLSLFDFLLDFSIDIPANCLPGEFQFGINVETNLEGSEECELVIRGRVLPDLVSVPSAVVLEIKRTDLSEPLVVSIDIESLSESMTDSAEVHFVGFNGVAGIKPQVSPHVLPLELSLQLNAIDAESTPWVDGAVRVEVSGGRSIEVPVLISITQ